jgi:putative DNA methylase
LAPDRVRLQLRQQRGGSDVVFDEAGSRIGGALMMAVVTLSNDTHGRDYRLPSSRDYAAVHSATVALDRLVARNEDPIPPVPNEPLPPQGTLGFRVQRYGMLEWGDLFTARQKLALCTFANAIRNMTQDSRVLCDLMALTLNHTTERCSSLCRWSPESYMETILGVFGRQALPMIWDFAEPAVLSESTGSFFHGLNVKTQAVASAPILRSQGQVQFVGDARNLALPDESAAVWFTDPPYYDAVPYSDLSDFFFVWLKRTVPDAAQLRDPFDASNTLTPKSREIVQDETRQFQGHPKDRSFFEQQIAVAFKEGNRILDRNGIASIVFAHKTTEGWEALLSGLVSAGWVITGSWPIATERPNRLRSRDSAALATSVHLVCRPRTEERIGDWADVLRELPDRVGEWMARLEREGVRGADLVFACIGPALEIFSQYSKVETPDGREVPLAEYLEKVWEVVGRVALNQILGTAEAQARNGGAGALEEDARLTALFLWTLRSTAGDAADGDATGDVEDEPDDADTEEDGGVRKPAKGFTLMFDIVRRFAQPLGIHLETWKDRIIQTEKGIVRLLPVTERARQLFGDEGAAGLADRIERAPISARQLDLFPAAREPVEPQPRARRRFATAAAQSTVAQITTLDRVHAAMLLQASGRTNGLRTLLAAEQERGPDFLRLGNALTALYPQGSEEKRLLDAMLLAVPR